MLKLTAKVRSQSESEAKSKPPKEELIIQFKKSLQKVKSEPHYSLGPQACTYAAKSLFEIEEKNEPTAISAQTALVEILPDILGNGFWRGIEPIITSLTKSGYIIAKEAEQKYSKRESAPSYQAKIVQDEVFNSDDYSA